MSKDLGYHCGHCKLTFRNYTERNFHEWQDHPGCPKNRVQNFADFNYIHCCRCPGDEPCSYCRPKGPYR